MAIKVDHPKDHPDVKMTEKSIKKDRKETKEKFPILSKILPTGNSKKDKAKAKRIADTLQTIGAKKMSASEGSFSKGGRAGYKYGKSVKKKSSGKAIRGKGCEIR
tara:strand:- start:156 stop:470 length:315 start_codon:yes stop_codon:yes gene_type:complete